MQFANSYSFLSHLPGPSTTRPIESEQLVMLLLSVAHVDFVHTEMPSGSTIPLFHSILYNVLLITSCISGIAAHGPQQNTRQAEKLATDNTVTE